MSILGQKVYFISYLKCYKINQKLSLGISLECHFCIYGNAMNIINGAAILEVKIVLSGIGESCRICW